MPDRTNRLTEGDIGAVARTAEGVVALPGGADLNADELLTAVLRLTHRNPLTPVRFRVARCDLRPAEVAALTGACGRVLAAARAVRLTLTDAAGRPA